MKDETKMSSQRKTNAVQYHLYVEPKKYNKLGNVIKKKQTQIQRIHQWLTVGRGKQGGARRRGASYRCEKSYKDMYKDITTWRM